MKISRILKDKDTGVSFEFFPPKTDKGMTRLSGLVDTLKTFDPLYTSMTYGAGGKTEDRTKEAVDLLIKHKDLVVMPHMTCIGADSAGLKSLLDGYRKAGLVNIMALRGDPISDGRLENKDFTYAGDLVKFIKRSGDFCVGVAVYPEGHIEAKSLDEDTKHTKTKIDSGADFAVTQMFFDNRYYFELLERMDKNGMDIPVLAGILPLTNIDKVKQFASICRATIPKAIEDKLSKLSNPEDMEKYGIEFTITQCKDLIRQGIKRLHFFTLNKPAVMETILKELRR